MNLLPDYSLTILGGKKNEKHAWNLFNITVQLLQKSFCFIIFQVILKHYWYFLYISAVKIIQTQPIKMRQIQLLFCVQNESLWPLCDSQQNLNRQRQRKDLSL